MKKRIVYTRHAKQRLKWRMISQSEVETVLIEPDKTEKTEEGRLNSYKKIGNQNLRVTYRELPDIILVISAVDKNK